MCLPCLLNLQEILFTQKYLIKKKKSEDRKLKKPKAGPQTAQFSPRGDVICLEPEEENEILLL